MNHGNYILALLALFATLSLHSCNSESKTTKNMETVCKVWGFLKYHHPNISINNIDWDNELFRILDEVSKRENSGRVNDILSRWVDSLGELPVSNKEKYIDSLDYRIKPDNRWIADLEPELSGKLSAIESFTGKFANKYINFPIPAAPGYPQFNEEGYADADYGDLNFRMLTLFRYWNVINYYYPYKHLIDREWNDILTEFVPLFMQADNREEVIMLIHKLTSSIDDSHTSLMYPMGMNPMEVLPELYRKNRIPIAYSYIEDQVVVSQIYDSAFSADNDIRIGDLITHIDGVPMKSVIEGYYPYYTGSNYEATMYKIMQRLNTTNDEHMRLSIRRSGETFQKDINIADVSQDMSKWTPIANEEKPAYRLIGNEVGYFEAGKITPVQLDSMMLLFKDTKGIIADLRGYPRVFNIIELFLSPGTPFTTVYTNDEKNPGAYYNFQQRIPNHNRSIYGGKLVIVADIRTMSAAETMAIALQSAPTAYTIGSRTTGANGNVVVCPLPFGISTLFSGIGMAYPDNTEMQRVGIKTDLVAERTINDIRDNSDNVLDKAITYIKAN